MPIVLRLVHRVIGLVVVLPLLLLVITGVPLQFTGALQLGHLGIESAWVHEAYGIQAPENVAIASGVTQVGDLVVVAGRTESLNGKLCGVSALDQLTLVMSSKEIVLIPSDNDVPVERNALEFRALRCGLSDVGVLVVVDQGQRQLKSTDFGVSWQPNVAQEVMWQKIETHSISKQQRKIFGARKLSWERWLQDLHSGRFFGDVGIWVMSLAGLAFVVLGISGVMMWFISRRPPPPR